MAPAVLQAMDLSSLRAVLAELRSELLPSRFEKVQQPEPHTLQLGLRTLKGLVWLEFSWRADCPRLVRIPPPSRLGSGSTLAQQLQHGLRQMALIELKQNGFERVVECGLAHRPGEPIQRTLVLEMMGRHSNLLLLDHQRQVITLGRQVRSNQSRVRPIGTGDVYVSPPPMQGMEANSKESLNHWRERLCLVPTKLRKALQQCYQGISPVLALQLADSDAQKANSLLELSVLEITDKQWQRLYQRWSQWLLCLEEDRFSLAFDGPSPYRVWDWDTNSSTSANTNGISLALGSYYRKHLDAQALNQLAKDLQKRLLQSRQREEQALDEQQRRLNETSSSSSFQQQADSMLCLPSPSKDLINQAQKLYRKAKRFRRSVPVLKERLEHHQQRLLLIEGSEMFLEDLLAANWEEQGERLIRLRELQQELDDLLISQSRNRQKRNRRNQQPPKPLELTTPGGLVIQVGRNHLQNDWISLRQARPGDLWFHAQECPGSHVVLKASNGLAEEIDLQLAADLAAHFSRAKGNHRVPVMMVPTSNLQRIPGAGPGTVRYREGSVYWAEPERGRKHLCT
ncbi:MAG: NFACT family protein [Prochlorococcus sp.]|nr:NFACT RNA binding domain-containing protein [Prochlorococcaceae cyanobacterium ETNP18_MAG_17]MDP6321491.1 NFACT RNA binding domain-containing protein [Prochlorococcaceae cyanobacterium ETNP14_MAG_5]